MATIRLDQGTIYLDYTAAEAGSAQSYNIGSYQGSRSEPTNITFGNNIEAERVRFALNWLKQNNLFPLNTKFSWNGNRIYDGNNLVSVTQDPVSGEWKPIGPYLADKGRLAYEEWVAGNKQRETEIRTGYDQMLRQLQGSGIQQLHDVNTAYAGLYGKGMQDLTSRGLTGTTILPSMKQSIERQRLSERRRVQDALLSNYQTMKTNKMNFIERIQDVQPNMDYYLNLQRLYANTV
jgi:hypothetical protein